MARICPSLKLRECRAAVSQSTERYALRHDRRVGRFRKIRCHKSRHINEHGRRNWFSRGRAYAFCHLILKNSSEHDLDIVPHAVISQWNKRFLGASQYLAIELHRNYAAADAKRVFDRNVIAGRATAE